MKPDPNSLYEMPHLKKGIHAPKLITVKINIEKTWKRLQHFFKK